MIDLWFCSRFSIDIGHRLWIGTRQARGLKQTGSKSAMGICTVGPTSGLDFCVRMGTSSSSRRAVSADKRIKVVFPSGTNGQQQHSSASVDLWWSIIFVRWESVDAAVGVLKELLLRLLSTSAGYDKLIDVIWLCKHVKLSHATLLCKQGKPYWAVGWQTPASCSAN